MLGGGGGAIRAALPMPLGSLSELLRPPALPGPRGIPLTPASPAPCAKHGIGAARKLIRARAKNDLPDIDYVHSNDQRRIKRRGLCRLPYPVCRTGRATPEPSAADALYHRDFWTWLRAQRTARRTADTHRQRPCAAAPKNFQCNHLRRHLFHKLYAHIPVMMVNEVPLPRVFPLAEEANMKDAKTYREYAADCIRMAKLMDPKDKEALLNMAQAWEERAREAERQEKKKDRS